MKAYKLLHNAILRAYPNRLIGFGMGIGFHGP